MASRPVQISLDDSLLKSIDRDSETRRSGRSAFVRAAVRHYLAAKRRGEISAAISRAYDGAADEMYAEIAEFINIQAWPRK